MEKPKVFISHSHKDKVIARGLVDLLEKVGLDKKNIIASSAPKAQLHTGAPIYKELRTALSNERVFVIFLLSDNFYSSTVCLNEMGAAWVMNADFHFMILPGFSFDRVKGVILEKSPIGISLATIDEENQSRLKDMCFDLANRYDFSINDDTLELGLINFFATVQNYRETLAGNGVFAMDKVAGLCINDTDNDGCRIWNRKSSNTKTTAIIDFSQTTSKLCSIVYRVEQQDWSSFRDNGKLLCFDAYSDSETFQAEIELHFSDHNEIIPLLITDDMQTYRLSLAQFDASADDWKAVKEVCFLFRKKHVDYKTTVYIENLRLE